MAVGDIEGNAPKLQKSPNTRRKINDISDIQGASPKDKGSMPGYKRNVSLPPKAVVPPSMHQDKPDREERLRVRSNAYQHMNTDQPKSSYANKDNNEGRVSQIQKPSIEKAYYGEENSSLMKPHSIRIAGSRRNTSGA